ncbi:MAG: hypothetical protein C4K58_03035 [Flavobacteriaceae bacterium]|nr:MAG: hypothetical protein C4K58_03035 [Flavobacteriaceae bacterium]
MKKLLFSIALCLGFANANAQDLDFGVRVATNFNNIASQGGKSSERGRFGEGAGLFATYNLSEAFAVQVEANYNNLGTMPYTTDPSGADLNQSAKTNLYYVQVPLLAKISLVGGLNLQVGPQAGYLFEGTAYATPVDGSAQTDLTTLEEFDYGVVGGIGYNVPNSQITLDARYYHGLSPFTTSPGDDGVELQHRNINLSVGYKF